MALSLESKTPLPNPVDCPTDDELQARLEERVSESRQDSLDSHVEECPTCQRRLNDLVNNQHDHEDLHSSWSANKSLSRVENASSSANVLSRLQGHILPKPELDRQFAKDLSCDGRQLRFLNIAGEGGMAVVFRCKDETTGQDLAVKVLRHQYVTNPDVREQFRKESQIQARLAHAGVADVFDTGELKDGRLYSIMEYCRGRTLSQRMQVRRNSEAKPNGLLAVFRSVCEVMAHAHSRGIRHRDLKPSNIHVGTKGDVKVLDWGLAQDASDQSNKESWQRSRLGPGSDRPETISGTPGYIAPEQIRGLRTTPSGDVYSLGVILSEVLTGQRVRLTESSVGDELKEQKTRLEIIQRIRASETKSNLTNLLERCLATQPSERPQDAGELLRQLDLATVPDTLQIDDKMGGGLADSYLAASSVC